MRLTRWLHRTAFFKTDAAAIVLHGSHNRIGGAGSAWKNKVANNLVGIMIDSKAHENQINHNLTYANSQPGINWNDDGVTANNSGIAPNYPLLSSAKSKTRRMRGTLTATPGHDVLIEYFSDRSCDSSGLGEGKKFIGAQEVLQNAMGNKKLSCVSPQKTKKGQLHYGNDNRSR